MKLPRFLTLMSILSLLFGTAHAESLKVGDKAPTISGTTDAGTTINLGDVYKQNAYTVVYFYPMADTPGCTKQGCSLRDANTELARKGVAIVGVSTDSVEAQKAFKDKFHFPFPLIADTDKKVVKAFGQAGTGRAAREAYLVDKSGTIVYKDQKVTDKQGENILNYLNTQKG